MFRLKWNGQQWFHRYEWWCVFVCGLLCLLWPLPGRPALDRVESGQATCGVAVAELLVAAQDQAAWRFELQRNCRAAQRTYEQMRWLCPALSGVALRAQELEQTCQSKRRP